jgi:hypothetical protein
MKMEPFSTLISTKIQNAFVNKLERNRL